MDTVGTLELAWAQGYDGGKAEHITHDGVCFKCGNNIKFVSADGTERLLSPPGDGIGPLAVHNVNRVLAVAEQAINPKIFVYQYPGLNLINEVQGGAKLEYLALAFSTSEYLGSISGMPDYQVTIWNYTDGTKLCAADVKHAMPTSFSFNPANWRQLCISTQKELSVWNIECSNDQYLISKQRMRLPAIDSIDEEDIDVRELPTRASTCMSRITVDIPRSAIAGVKGVEAELFEEYQDKHARAVPLTHVWLPTGDIVIGCAGGQLLKVDSERYSITMMYNPSLRQYSSLSLDDATIRYGHQTSELDASMNKGRKVSMLEDGSKAPETTAKKGGILKKLAPNMLHSSLSGDPSAQLMEGSVTCLGLHKDGLYAAGDDGILRHLEINNDTIRVKESYSIGTPITAMSWNGPHSRLALGSSRGSVHIFEPANPNSIACVMDIHCGQFIGVDVLPPGTDLCVSVREDGELQVWNMSSGNLISAMPIGLQATKMAVSPLTHVAVVGTVSGYVYYVDLNKLDSPRIIHRVRMHQGPIKHLVFNYNGRFLLTGSDDGTVFVVDGRPSKNYEPIGHVSIKGAIVDISTVFDESKKLTKVAVAADTLQNGTGCANRLTHFELPFMIDKEEGGKYASLKLDFDENYIKQMTMSFPTPTYGVCLCPDHAILCHDYNTKQMQKIFLPQRKPKEDESSEADPADSYIYPDSSFTGHGLPMAHTFLSPHQKWVASYGMDGMLSVRALGALDRTIDVFPHNYRTGGVEGCVFAADGARMFTCGGDGNLTCYKWNGQQKAKSAVESMRAKQTSLLAEQQHEDAVVNKMPDWSPPMTSTRPLSEVEKAEKEQLEKEEAVENAIENDIIYSTPTPTPNADATWLEQKELEAIKEEDKEYSHIKKELRTEIRDMRRQIQAMMKENEGVPDIERLARHEFDLDVEEQARLQAEADAEVTRIRDEKEFENLAKMYLADLIKQECWDGMDVKGRGIMAFHSFLECHNYPMRSRSKEEMKKLSKAVERRQVELAELAARKEFEALQKPNSTTADDELNEAEDVEGEGKEQPSTMGSLGDPAALYGGGSDLFYSQFELHTREQKITQIALLEDAIHRIKTAFNKEFDGVFDKKQGEIQKISEKNRRMRKIFEDLDMNQEIWEPEMGILERPEKLLVVEDYEVKVEKYLTPEQRRKLEAEQRVESDRRAKEKGDNWRDRGLEMMMGGVLEIKKEDELKKDIPQPGFMTVKPEDEWTEDEKRMAQDYLRKVRELAEERDKYRKQLEMELKKLQTQIQESAVSFDEALQALFNRKIKTEMVIYQEELKILRLKHSLLLEEELNNREDELTTLLDFKKDLKVLSNLALSESRKNVEAFRERYDTLVIEDKLMDRSFKRDFNDIPGYLIDQLHKLYRRRPRGQKGRTVDTPTFDPAHGNPFAERPSTARQNDAAKVSLESALAELDRESNAPEGVENHVWERMCRFRRQKIESEQLVKQKALVFADMQAFLQKRQEEDEDLRQEIDDIIANLNKLKEDRMRFTCNLEVQLLLKQGQVEVDAGPFIHDYHDSILIHRQVVEDLNQKIRHYGESKISSMVESKDNRKSIVQLEWEHKRMTMEMEDLQNKQRDVQNLKVTREIQAFLNEADHEAKKAQEINILEQTLQVQTQHHEKNVGDKKKMLKDLKKVIKDKSEANSSLSNELEELNVSVNERKHIHEVNADKRSDAGAEKRYREIVQRRKLVDLAKAQAQEVAVLRAEVERLRMRTFPALVQVEH